MNEIMEKILYLAHTESDGTLGKAALEALSAVVELTQGDASLSVGLVGEEVQGAADAIAGCGAERFLGVAGAQFGASRYGSDAAAAVALVEAAAATIVIAPATSRFCRALPGAAQRLGGRIDTQVTRIESDGGELKAQRWYYRQRMVGTLTRQQRPWLLLVAGGLCEAWQGESGSAAVEAIALELAAARTQVAGVEAASTDAQTIRPDADLLLVAGAGWTKKQADQQTHIAAAESLILGFLEKAQASLGSSKSLVDQGSEGEEVLPFLSHLNQVGQTGSTPRHPKGLATCCHGEEPHVVGWRFINERRAVNLDSNCGWAQGKADVLYVADAFKVMEKVGELLDES